ncbi:Chemokine-like receptor 1 [Triplophysa tibetana]|uniref:Chemokine-like receptor 1 n=1 Tax=Triplophysa tibetana TaxID=1572043 RepID=A0A5A9P2Y6_9TELE|nr:Chemokine-like receptor 1 [Triplophysa tibetana]KAA0716844.1 Chemokine-like receptor 1 [Triplophysa tibetana]
MNSTPEGNSNEYEYQDALNDDSTEINPGHCRETSCVFSVILNVIIFLLGIIGNGAVIWIAGFKMKKKVNTTWYLSLAMSDFLFCSTLPLIIVKLVTNNWPFGLFMCKFTSFVMFINMYSSIFILVIISVDRCLTVRFPVWAQNNRSIAKANVVVALAWVMSALLSIPAAKFRNIRNFTLTSTVCYNEYEGHHPTAVFIRFSFGFLIPFLSICLCYSILICKLRENHRSKSNKPYKIMTLLIVTFFLCWMPFHIVALMEFGEYKHDKVFHSAQYVTATIACANSCLNPFLYSFMAKDLKKKCYYFLSKIESGIDEETRSGFRGTSITNSGDHRLSTAV